MQSVILMSLSAISFQPIALRGVAPRLPRVPVAPRLAAEGDTRKEPLPFLQQGVPEDQQPAIELRNMLREPFYDWADDESFTRKLGYMYAALSVVSLPVAYSTYSVLPNELPQLLLSANIGTLCVMLLFVARLRSGWGAVSQRLRDPSIYYEAQQTGNLATKDRETLMRDRLIERTRVSPVLRRIDSKIIAIVAVLVLSAAAGEGLAALLGESGPATPKTLYGNEALAFTEQLKKDDVLAYREQQRAQARARDDGSGVLPTYCGSRYYKILAGGNGAGGVGCGQ